MNDTDKKVLQASENYPSFRGYYISAKKKEVPVRARWSADEDVLLYELMAKNKSYAEIGKIMGRTQKSVEMRAFSLRKKMRNAGMQGQSKVMSKNRPAKRKATAKKASPKKAPAPEKEAPKPEQPPSTPPNSVFDKHTGELIMLSAAGAAGIWLILILLGIGFIQKL
ncbi:MAG: hypothetical protein ACPG3V_09105 [Porticoccaceae bacterium]|jgi:hypothetical protein